VTAGKYYTQMFRYSAGQGTFSADKLDASTPNATLSGPPGAMHLQATLPAGTLDLNLGAQGPALYNDGTGLVPFLAGSTHYYSLPRVSTTGTLVETAHVTPWQVTRGSTTSGATGTAETPMFSGPTVAQRGGALRPGKTDTLVMMAGCFF
jgi:predicted secreted hydrolase